MLGGPLPTRPNGEGIETGDRSGLAARQGRVRALFRRALTEKGLKPAHHPPQSGGYGGALPTRPNGEGIETLQMHAPTDVHTSALPTRPNGEGIETTRSSSLTSHNPSFLLFRRALTEKGLKLFQKNRSIPKLDQEPLPTRPNGEGIETCHTRSPLRTHSQLVSSDAP